MSIQIGAAAALESTIVPIDTLEKIADAKAFETWGPIIARGEPVALASAVGIYAYEFPYALNATEFPAQDTLSGRIRALRERFNVASGNTDIPDAYLAELRRFGESFGSVCVSATCTAGPVLWISHFLPSFYMGFEAARNEAARRLASDETTIVNYYFFSPEEQYFEFAAPGERLLLDPMDLRRDVPPHALAQRPREPESEETNECIRSSWAGLTAAVPSQTDPLAAAPALPAGAAVLPRGIDSDAIGATIAKKKIAYWELIPIVQHTPKHWCVVASKAMVLGFYDNYVNGMGTLLGFGRFIDYWYEMTPGGYNAPNLADEMIPPADAAKINGYSWYWTETKGDAVKLWNTLKAEIDAGRPCFFSIPGHTTAAFGYRIDSSGDRFAIVYDPPNPNTPTYVNEYNISGCTGIGAVIPTGGTPGQGLVIIQPDGGDAFYSSVPNEIVWFVWGDKITAATISLSEDGGNTWKTVAAGVPAKGAWNGYAWIGGNTGNRIRIRVDGFTASGALIAADGSHQNLGVKPPKTGAAWKKIWGATEQVIARGTPAPSGLLMYAVPDGGDGIYRYDGWPMAWTKVGGPGKMFVLDNAGHLYGLSPDGGGVYRYDGTPMKWTQVGGPAATIYAGGGSLFATNPQTGDIYQYGSKPMTWTRVGGPGKSFTVDAKGRLYGISPDGAAIFRYDGVPMKWTKVGGPASAAWSGGCGLYATAINNGDVFHYSLAPMLWTRIGAPGKMFAVDDAGRLYGLSVDATGVYRYDGAWNYPQKWTRVGDAAGKIFAAANGRLFATNPQTHDLMSYE